MKKYKEIHPKDILPNCPYCHRPINYIKRKGLCAIKVEPKGVRYLPQENGPVTIITPKGNRRKGVLHNDGIDGYIEHRCNVR